MAMLIVSLTEKQLEHLPDTQYGSIRSKHLFNQTKEGVAIHDNATNGDVLKALFPNMQDVDVDWFGEEWWNATYEGGRI